jgi:hypothetical protein
VPNWTPFLAARIVVASHFVHRPLRIPYRTTPANAGDPTDRRSRNGPSAADSTSAIDSRR